MPLIVLAEDNSGDVELVREALRQHDVQCDLRVLSDGAEAMAYVDQLELDRQQRCPALMLLDLHLPKHDGKEVLARLRTRNRCAQTPVVILTSSESPVNLKALGDPGILHYF